MNPIEWITKKFETRPEPFVWEDPKNGTKGVAIVHDESQHVHTLSLPEQIAVAEFPRVSCVSADDLIRYLGRHAVPNETIVFANIAGLSAITDYCTFDEDPPLLEPGLRARRVQMPAAWAPECHQAMTVIERSLGQWIGLDSMETLLDIAAPFVAQVTEVRDVLFELDGVEAVKVKRSALANTVETGSSVQAKGNKTVPATISLTAVFMGRKVEIRIPLRVRVQNSKIEFSLINNGTIQAAKIAAVSEAAASVSKAGWFVIEGEVA